MPGSRLTVTELDFFRLQTSILVKFVVKFMSYQEKGGVKAAKCPLYVGGGGLSTPIQPIWKKGSELFCTSPQS